MPRLPRTVLFGLGLSLAGCSTAPIEIPMPRPAAEFGIAVGEFPGAASLLSGFDERQPDGTWASGDAVLLGLHLQRGGTELRWLLRIEVAVGEHPGSQGGANSRSPGETPEKTFWSYTATHGGTRTKCSISSRMVPVVTTVYDADGTKLGSSTVKLPTQLLGSGMLAAVDCALANERSALAGPQADLTSPEHLQPMVRGVLGLMGLLEIMQNDKVLRDYFWQVVEKPSVWSVVTSLGVTASLSVALEKSVPAVAVPAGLPPQGRAYVVPLCIDVNGRPALLAEVLAVDSARPYALCGGMIGVTARHPSRTDVRLGVQVLGARIGSRDKRPVTAR